MSLDAAILGFLDEEPRSGYDLKTRCFDGAARDFWTADQAQIYRTLERLQASRLVTVTRRRQSGKPDRKIYSLTELGRHALAEWLASGLPLTPPRDAFLLQLYFAAASSDGDLLAHLRDRRALHQARLQGLRDDALAAAQAAGVSARQASLRDAAFSGAMAAERAAIDWLDDCIDGLEAGSLPPANESLFGSTTA